ncbi:MAG: hypothetical protein A2002_07085 [Pseudomonadales bacterium GWC1_66_9]|uniref:Uncharacterized protein n=1 Tax=Azotobacter chroococcum NCIMB 8003 TaxID=1328314 RepID=A0A0C4WT71_9GAMM|nr:hypothetical protein [Azotobacter chroococcum]AJE22805.1 Hypothetical protein Achr_34000 [Azotobacter chroococcum NCIMB 8003]OHC11736.1 MAG: hypothetical protein A2002_07085 [Pseudomonadales bacterium GWC1_66_9]
MTLRWITYALVSMATLYINHMILGEKDDLQEQINLLREELRTIRISLDHVEPKSHKHELDKYRQHFEITVFPRAEERIHF